MNLQRVASTPAREASAAAVVQDNSRVIETSIPARLDHLSWSGFHTRVLALGITWILEGLEVTLAGASALMIAAAAVAWRYGVAAERRSLESVAKPLALVE